MALQVKTGNLQTPTSTGNQSYTGVGFQPKVVLFFITDMTTTGVASHFNVGFGATNDNSEQRAITAWDENNLSTTDSGSTWAGNVIISHAYSVLSVRLVASTVSMDADGFTLNWTTVDSSAREVNYIALGGDDLLNHKIGYFTQTASTTGTNAVTGLGFQPDTVLIATITGNSPPPALHSYSRFSLGYANKNDEQGHISFMSEDGQGTSDTRSRLSTSSILSLLSPTTDAEYTKAEFVSMDADGFTVNFTQNDYASDSGHVYIALQGIRSKIGTFDTQTSTGNFSVTGVGFQPKTVLFNSILSSTTETIVAGLKVSNGVAVSSSERFVSGGVSEDAQIISDTDSFLDRTSVYQNYDYSQTIQGDIDFVSMDSGGFTLNQTDADPSANKVLYLALGDSAGKANHAKANIVRTESVNNSAKASLIFVREQNNSAKSNVKASQGAYSVGQGSDTNNANSIMGGTAASGETSQALGQSFKVVRSGNIHSVSLKMYKFGTPTDNVRVSIVESLGGTVLGTSEVSATSFSAGQTVNFNFTTPISVSLNTTYFVQIERTGARDETNRAAVYIYYAGAYTDGVNYFRDNNSWSADGTGSDNRFFVNFVETSNQAKADVLVTDVTKNNFAKGSIVKAGEQPNYSTGSIIRSNIKNESSAKANIIRANETQNNSAKGNLYDIYRNSAKANIKNTYSQNNSAKADIPLENILLYAKGDVARVPLEKRYQYRVYDGTSFVTLWSREVLSEPRFRMVINGGPGEMTIKLDRPFDNFGEDIDVKLFNKVEVWCFDREAPNGVLIYSGYISGYRPVLEEHSEYIEVTLLSYVTQLSEIMLRNESGETDIAQNSLDPSAMFKNIIDYYKTDGGLINYSSNVTVDDTSTTASYTFTAYTTKEALDKVIELTPENWYWRVDADNLAYLKESNLTTADHTFVIGRHINFMETWRRGEDIVNTVYFVGQETAGVPMYRVYRNTASIDAYGIHAVKKVDSRVTATTTADIIANRILDKKKDPEIRTTMVILDNNGQEPFKGYDIESIKPGQSMRIRNIQQALKTITLWDVAQWDEDVWDQTLSYAAANIIQILAVEYTPNAVRIEASSRLPEISKRVEEVYRNWEESQTWNTPTSPTEG